LARPFVIKANNGSATSLYAATLEGLVPIEPFANAGWRRRIGRPWASGPICTLLRSRSSCSSAGDVLPWDYKFMVFNGRVEFIQVDTGRPPA
jgi:hypothetical protein